MHHIAELRHVSPERLLDRTRTSLRALTQVRADADITINVGVRAVYRYIVEHDHNYVDHWVRHEMHASSGIEIATVLDCICDALLAEIGTSTAAIHTLDALKTHVSEIIRAERHCAATSTPNELVDAVIFAVAEQNPELADHLIGVGQLAGRIALSMGFAPNLVDYIVNAGKLHDIGKIGVPRRLLRKPEPLKPGEMETLQRHSVIGERLLHEVPGLERYALATRMHHEALDGSGYPDGVRAESLPIEIRIISAADVYDALTSKQCYREPFTQTQALAMLHEGSGTRWDAEVVHHLGYVVTEDRRQRQIA